MLNMTLDLWRYPLRDWQEEASDKCFEKYQNGCDSFLATATPGAGKTTFALRIAHKFIQLGWAKRVVIAVPTDHLKTQWAKSAAEYGIKIDPNVSNEKGIETRDFHGMAVTYAQLGLNPEIHKRYVNQFDTLVILDECHHAGESLTWGSGVQAFENSVFKLLLSGTPFRSDNNPIPFVSYENGISYSDYSYTYTQAIVDNVCRLVYFPAYDGNMEWQIGGDDEDTVEKFKHSFTDSLNKSDSSRRLKTALSTKGDWLKQLVYDANKKLDEIRRTEHPTAGGLIACIDQKHAKKVAEVLRQVTGETAVLVLSDDSEASEKIKEFRTSSAKWIIAVKMVSEGVDIPRLRVGVYATNVKKELFFRQLIGRFVRVISDLGKQDAFVFIPKDEDLIRFVVEIEKERQHALNQMPANSLFEGQEGFDTDNNERQKGVKFKVISSEATTKQTLKTDINSKLMRMFGVDTDTSNRILENRPPKENKQQKSTYEIREELKKEVNRLAKEVVEKTQAGVVTKDWRQPHKEWKLQGGKSINEETIPELEKRIQWLKSKI